MKLLSVSSYPYALVFNLAQRSVLKTTYKCQILLSATRVVDNITAIMFKNLKCERISEVKSTFSAVVLVLLFGVLVHAEIINHIITNQTF